jgi:hypothetical protein
MRACLLIAIFAAATAGANPRVVGPAPLSAFLSSEKLRVSVTATDAVFSGSFTFSTTEPLRPPSEADPWRGARSLTINLYVWFPEESNGDPIVAEFWRTFRKGDINLLTTNAAYREIFDRAVGLRVRVGERELRVGRDIDSFVALPYRPPDPEADRFISGLFKAMHEPEPGSEQLTEPGFYLLVLWFHDNGKLVWNQTPVSLSYRQPLARLGGESRFFYVPVFADLPDGSLTADTNHYSLTFEARGCSLAITNGTQRAFIENGCSATLAPQIHQPFRAISKPHPTKGLSQ